MPSKRILLFHEDPTLQPYLEQKLNGSGSVVSIQSTARAKRKVVNQTFPFIIIEARKNWYKDLQRFHRLNGRAGNSTILVASSSFLHHQGDSVKSLSGVVLGTSDSNGLPKISVTPSEELCLKDFVERKLKVFVNNMKAGGARNLHSMLLAEVERPMIAHILKETKGNQIQAARLLGMNRNTLRKKIKELKIAYKPSERHVLKK